MAPIIQNPPAHIDSTKKRKTRAPKDPNAPKRSKSAYICFTQERRPALKAAHPEKGVTQLAPLLGKEWGTLSDEAKQPYKAKADEDKARYAAEMADYVVPAKKNMKKKKDPHRPKRGKSAYIIFTMDRRPALNAAHPEKGVTQLSSLFGKEWAALSDEDKQPYLAKAEEDKGRYAAEMASYTPTASE